ncbi:MAG: CehA/McbA family metallohydrolase [Planctomycetota bacterium]
MKPEKTVLAATGTGLLLFVAIALHAVGQFGGASREDAPVEAVTLDASNFDEHATAGKEADAIYGDIALRNGFLTAVIAQPLATRHANMTVKDVAGSLIDFSVRGKTGGDQLAAFYPGRKNYSYRSVAPLSPAGGSSVVTVKADGTDERAEAIVAYTLNQKDRFLTVTSTFTNRGANPVKVVLEDDFRADGGKEDMTRTPDGTVDQFWLYDRFWSQAYGIDAEGYKLQVTSDARNSVIRYENAAGETSVKLAPGESFQLKRRLYPGATIFDVQALLAKDVSPVSFSVPTTEDLGYLQLEISQDKKVLGIARLDAAGKLKTQLPVGLYSARLYFVGNAGGTYPIEIKPGANDFDFDLNVPRGRVVGAVTDTAGGNIPCKVELKPLDEKMRLDFGPDSADYAVRNLVYTPNGKFEQTVPAGKYAVTVSHGPEFDTIESELDVKPGNTATFSGKLVRSVDTAGWVSSDFHSHSTPSGDNTSSQLGRVLNLVCEHVEFAPCTEHNRVSTYQPHIKTLGIEAFFSTVSGIELTGSPLPLNHQNAFPMKYTPRVQDGGGPTAGPDLESQIERLALWDQRSEKLVQVNHPDMGWMFYDKNGDGMPDAGFERAFPFMDVVEIHPIDHVLELGPTANRGTAKFHNTIFNWLQLLNQGFRIYGVVNTDAHYNFHGSGFLRNWIQSSTDDPAKINHMEMVHAAEQGRVVMSNGPYLDVTASEVGKSEKVVSGQDLKAPSGKVTLRVRVQCPNWLDVNRVFVLVNGRIHPLHNYSRQNHADAFRSGIVKFERTLELELKGDAHIVVATGHVGGKLGAVYGPTYGTAQPAALTNPIFVDVDGNGFQPNKDTLDAPLPVKYPTSK